MTDPSKNDELTRTIVLIYGALESGNPFWLFAAVKPNRYQPMLEAQKAKTLDLYKFDSYGEIIVSGEGKSPPDEVTLKVADMYQTSAEVLMKALKDEKNE